MIRRVAVAAVLIGAAAVTGGLVLARHDDPPVRAAAVPTENIGAVPTDPAPDPAPARPVSGSSAVGSHLVLRRLGVDAPVTGVAVDGRVMQVPRDPQVVGWWRAGAAPGSGRGSVVVVGHVNYAGTAGAFGVLPRARPGDGVSLGDHRYRVAAVRSYPKTTGIPDAAFATTGRERLVLITCGGSFDSDTGNYVDNVVVYAVPVT